VALALEHAQLYEEVEHLHLVSHSRSPLCVFTPSAACPCSSRRRASRSRCST
jgi:hypothetical protein